MLWLLSSSLLSLLSHFIECYLVFMVKLKWISIVVGGAIDWLQNHWEKVPFGFKLVRD